MDLVLNTWIVLGAILISPFVFLLLLAVIGGLASVILWPISAVRSLIEEARRPPPEPPATLHK
jgi:hypothetical protein